MKHPRYYARAIGGETANMIYCAAPYPECNFHIAFGNRAEKKEYRKNFCCTTGYGRCIIAKGVEQDKTRGEI